MTVLLLQFVCLALSAFLHAHPSQLRLMNFIRRIGRNEIYIKYVHQLVNVGVILLPPRSSQLI